MATDNEKASSVERAIAALERLASTPNAAKRTVKEQLAEPTMWAAIQKAKMARHDTATIAAVLKSEGIDVKPTTLTVYMREIEREKRGGDEAKPRRKRNEMKSDSSASSKPSTGQNSASGSEAKGETGSASAQNATDAKSTSGKTLTQKPGMGGAFSTDEL